MRQLFIIAVLIFSILWTSGRSSAAEILVAAAADLNFAVKEIVAEFEKKSPHRVKLTLGSSGNFHSQIKNGAPFDVYFSADIQYPAELEKAGLTEPGTLFTYAIGRIVVWVPAKSPINVEKLQTKAFFHPSVRKVAIANPSHAPYGRAAVSALQHYGIYENLKDKFVLGENISQTAQFIDTGAADIGVIALAIALAPSVQARGKHWEIPLEAFPRMTQGAAILKAARDKGNLVAAREFYNWIKSPSSQAILKRYGFFLPEGPARN
ncbi:MAG TPA: molybdate ABC transporter substrate-binding protein [Candidatus Limnocylindria bacterium]|nr:molybdate ABC transporter substrate-binding protein [Candidatus Limnocylindria bacterium]